MTKVHRRPYSNTTGYSHDIITIKAGKEYCSEGFQCNSLEQVRISARNPTVREIASTPCVRTNQGTKATTTYCVSREWLLRFIYVPLNARVQRLDYARVDAKSTATPLE